MQIRFPIGTVGSDVISRGPGERALSRHFDENEIFISCKPSRSLDSLVPTHSLLIGIINVLLIRTQTPYLFCAVQRPGERAVPQYTALSHGRSSPMQRLACERKGLISATVATRLGIAK